MCRLGCFKLVVVVKQSCKKKVVRLPSALRRNATPWWGIPPMRHRMESYLSNLSAHNPSRPAKPAILQNRRNLGRLREKEQKTRPGLTHFSAYIIFIVS